MLYPLERDVNVPYIKQREREFFDEAIDNLNRCVGTEGELNYVITRLVTDFVRRAGGNYAAFNAAIGVLECAKLEMYRRAVAPYEDLKIAENGDAY